MYAVLNLLLICIWCSVELLCTWVLDTCTRVLYPWLFCISSCAYILSSSPVLAYMCLRTWILCNWVLEYSVVEYSSTLYLSIWLLYLVLWTGVYFKRSSWTRYQRWAVLEAELLEEIHFSTCTYKILYLVLYTCCFRRHYLCFVLVYASTTWNITIKVKYI